MTLTKLLDPTDPDLASQVEVLYDRLSGLGLTRFQLSASSPEVPAWTPTPGQRTVLDAGGWLQPALVDWRLPDDVGTARHSVWLLVRPAGDPTGAVRLAGLVEPSGRAKQGPRPTPLWMLADATTSRVGRSTALVADLATGSADWLSIAHRSSETVRTALGERRDWSGQTVVEVPATQGQFEAMIDAAPGSYRQIAAVTWPDGPDLATAALRIVINPVAVAGLPEASLQVLLTHEIVHVATHSVDSPAPTWLVEGLADQIAFAPDPESAAVTEQVGLDRIRAGDRVKGFPRDADFAPGASHLATTYALAWLACHYLAETYGVDRLLDFYDLVDGGTSVDEAARQQYDRTEQQLVDSWRAWLRRAAAG